MLGSSLVMGFVPVTDGARARAFYVNVLGLRLVEANPHGEVVDADGTSVRLIVFEGLVPQPFTILGWAVQDIANTIDGLAAAGVVFERYDGFGQDERGIWTTPGGDLVAWFKDPDGNVLSLTELTED